MGALAQRTKATTHEFVAVDDVCFVARHARKRAVAKFLQATVMQNDKAIVVATCHVLYAVHRTRTTNALDIDRSVSA